MALLRIFHRRFVRAFRDAQRQGGNRDATAVQNFHRLNEPFAHFAQHLAFVNPAIVENHFCRFGSAHAEFIFLFTGKKARRATFYHESRHAVAV